MPSRITVDKMPVEKQFNKLKQEGKMYKNVIIMLAYRAETALYNMLPRHYKNANKKGRALNKQFLIS